MSEPENNRKRVCICIPTFNAGATISATLDSLLAQTYPNIRIKVVDNASTDTTAEIVNTFALKDSRLSLFRNPENVGAEGNFTRCLSLAEGDYTAIFHSDDIYGPDIIAKQVAILSENPAVGAVFTEAFDIDGAGVRIGKRTVPKELCGRPQDFMSVFSEVLKLGNFLICPSVMARTEIYKNQIQVWNGKEFKTSADLDVWLKIAGTHKLYFIPEPLMNYRVSPSSFSYNLTKIRCSRHDIFLVLDSYIKKYSDKLSGRNLSDYQLLLLKDDINIAINLIIKGETKNARLMLKKVFYPGNILASLATIRKLKFLLIGFAAFFLSILPPGKILSQIVRRIRHSS